MNSKSVHSEIAKFPGTFPGTIKAPLDIPSLTESADIVCKGEVVCLYDEGEVQYLAGNEPITFKQKVAVFHVDRIYKGTISMTNIEIEFLQSDFPSSLESLNRGECVLIFLVSKNARYQFVNLTMSKMPISCEPVPTLKGRASPLVRIRKALIKSLTDANQDIVLAAIEQLGNLKSKETVASLQPFETSQDPIIRCATIAALLKFGDMAYISVAVRFLGDAPDMPGMERVKSYIYGAIAELSNPSLMDSLTPLLQYNDMQLRYAAIRALRNIRSRSTIPFLIKALDDDYLDVRYQAMMALAEVTQHPEWCTTIDVFRHDETKYISKWKAWFAQEETK
jgi:hypothetical protein